VNLPLTIDDNPLQAMIDGDLTPAPAEEE